MSNQKNWFGWSIHPTDDMLYWQEVKFDSKGKLKKEVAAKVNKLRESYDTIVNAGFKEDLKVLLEAAYDHGWKDGSEWDM